MQEPYSWFVLYVKSNTEQRVVEDVKRAFSSYKLDYGFEPFCPETEKYYRSAAAKKSGDAYRKRPLFPGYIFIETDMPQNEFLREFSTYLYNSEDIIRVLKQGASGDIALPLQERKRLEYLLKGKRCLEHSVGYYVGDSVRVEAGALVGCEGLITYIDRHNRFAVIEVDMFGSKAKARVALEIVGKKDA